MPKFGPTVTEPYPDEMRTQLWPLCCGAAIISGFKDVGAMSEAELLAKINSVVDEYTPDHQVYIGEHIHPNLTFLTLNADQMASKKIMDAVTAAGFVKVLEAAPRGSPQGFFARDKSGTLKVVNKAA